jgi:1-acyl-sn-glycerol-3-phosphate acyltransferase
VFDFFDSAKDEEIPRSPAHHPFDGWSLDERDPKVIEGFMPVWGWLYEHYFRVQTSGWEHLPPPGKMLLVGSHNGGLAAPDMFMFMYDWYRRFGYNRPAYGLMHPTVWKAMPAVAQLAVNCGAIVAHPKMAITALRRNAAVLVYPGGAEDVFRPYAMRHEIYFAGRKGFIKLALREKAPIVPCISIGAHETLMVLADCYDLVRQFHEWGMPWLFGIDPVVFPIYLGLPWGICFGPLPHIPVPVQIHTRICPPIIFEKYGQDAANDREYVDVCFAKVKSIMQQELDLLIANS